MTLDVRAKRVYETTTPGDGYRILIDHIWPRGVTRERARLDEWARELGPPAQGPSRCCLRRRGAGRLGEPLSRRGV